MEEMPMHCENTLVDGEQAPACPETPDAFVRYGRGGTDGNYACAGHVEPMVALPALDDIPAEQRIQRL